MLKIALCDDDAVFLKELTGIKGNSKTGFRGTEVRAAGYSGLKQIKTPQISIE